MGLDLNRCCVYECDIAVNSEITGPTHVPCVTPNPYHSNRIPYERQHLIISHLLLPSFLSLLFILNTPHHTTKTQTPHFPFPISHFPFQPPSYSNGDAQVRCSLALGSHCHFHASDCCNTLSSAYPISLFFSLSFFLTQLTLFLSLLFHPFPQVMAGRGGRNRVKLLLYY